MKNRLITTLLILISSPNFASEGWIDESIVIKKDGNVIIDVPNYDCSSTKFGIDRWKKYTSTMQMKFERELKKTIGRCEEGMAPFETPSKYSQEIANDLNNIKNVNFKNLANITMSNFGRYQGLFETNPGSMGFKGYETCDDLADAVAMNPKITSSSFINTEFLMGNDPSKIEGNTVRTGKFECNEIYGDYSERSSETSPRHYFLKSFKNKVCKKFKKLESCINYVSGSKKCEFGQIDAGSLKVLNDLLNGKIHRRDKIVKGIKEKYGPSPFDNTCYTNDVKSWATRVRSAAEEGKSYYIKEASPTRRDSFQR